MKLTTQRSANVEHQGIDHSVSIPQPTGRNCQPQRVFFFPAGFLLTAGKRKKATRITCSKFKRQELSPPTPVCLPKAPASDRGILRRLRLLRMTALSNQRPDEGKAGCRRRGRKKAVRFFRSRAIGGPIAKPAREWHCGKVGSGPTRCGKRKGSGGASPSPTNAAAGGGRRQHAFSAVAPLAGR